VEIGYGWLMKARGCSFAFKELAALGYEIPDVLGFRDQGTILIECKTSRSDFFADGKKFFRINPKMGMGEYRFYLCPEGMIVKEDLPEKWGLIYAKDGRARMKYNPYAGEHTSWINGFGREERNYRNEWQIMFSALRRLHIRNRLDEIYERPPTEIT
jgi:hypothetical protein